MYPNIECIEKGFNINLNEDEAFIVKFSDRKLINRVEDVVKYLNQILEVTGFNDEYIELLSTYISGGKFEPVLESVDKIIDTARKYAKIISGEEQFIRVFNNNEVVPEDSNILLNYFKIAGKMNIREYLEHVKALKYKPNKVEIEEVKAILGKYVTKDKVNYWSFVNKSRQTKTSIMFPEEEIEKIFALSCIMKMCIPFTNSNYSMKDKQVRVLFFAIEQRLKMKVIVHKIYNLVKGRVFKFTIDDSLMWDLFKIKSQINEYTFVLKIFNNIINYLMATFNLKANPITYISVYVGDFTKWYLRGIYNLKQTFNEEIGISDNVGSYYNGLAKAVIYQDLMTRIRTFVRDRMKTKNINLAEWENNLDQTKFDYTFIEIFVVPIVCNILGIKQNSFFLLLDIKDKLILQLFLYFIIQENLGDMPITDILRCLIYKNKSIINNTYKNYKINDINNILSTEFVCYGTNNKLILQIFFANTMAKLKGVKFRPIFGNELFMKRIDFTELETDMVNFIKIILTNNIPDKIKKIKEKTELELRRI